MIGSEAAFSLPWRGSSMANLIVPFDESPAGFGVVGVSPVPPLPPAAVEAAGVLLQADRASRDTPASAPNFRNFMHCPPRTLVVRMTPERPRSALPPSRPAAPGREPSPD